MHYVPTLALGVLALSMFFALLSYALRQYSVAGVENRFRDADRQSDLERFLATEDEIVLAASIWRLAANIAYGVLMGLHLLSLDSAVHRAVVAVVAVALAMVFGVAVPQAWAKYRSERIVFRLVPLLHGLRRASWPMLRTLGLFDDLIRRLAGVPKASHRGDELENELLSVVKEGEMEGAFEEDETEMIESIIEFKDTDVAEIMTPRTDMVCLSQDIPLAEAREKVVEAGHSRIPAYEENLDTIVGVLYAKDVLKATGEEGFEGRAVRDIMRKALFIPETKKLTELLHDFQQAGVHIALVLDEYGGTAGLVTIEDVIEEIVGEITDEYDVSEPEEIHRLSEAEVEVDARIRINELNDELEIELPEDEDYDTLGGFVFSKLGAIPEPGETLQYDGLTLTVLEADERRVVRVGLSGLDTYVRPEEE